MSFPIYPQCKDSGVDWMGEVPSHWDVKKFRYLFQESGEKIEDEVVGEMLSVSGYRGIEVKEYEYESSKRTEDELVGYRIVRPGQLVVNTMWLNYAGLGVSDYEGHVSPAYKSYWIDGALEKRYIHHLMRSEFYVNGYKKYLTGIRPNSLQMNRDDMMSFPILVPNHEEQKKIAAFLDHETAKIDALIEEQRCLIELLKEKRQAVISHAVIKGLDPNAPMKDSGVEWLGEVPAHWDVVKLKKAISKIESGTSVNASDIPASQGNYGVLKTSCVYRGWFDWRENKLVVDEDRGRVSCPLKSGTLIVSRMNTPDLVGAAGLVTEAPDGVFLPDRLWQVSVKGGNNPKFIYYFTQTNVYREQVKVSCSGTSSSMQNLGQDDFGNIFFVAPPEHEQTSIADIIDKRVVEMNQMIEEAERGIKLLNERRSALISAAVTGKIDVRDWQPPASETQTPENARAGATA